MNNYELFCHISSKRIAKLIRDAKRLVCYAGPGIQLEPAKAMVEAARRIDPEQLTVSLDINERVLRMGYGDMEAVRKLKDAGIGINHAEGLRSALIIVDGEGYIFTPTALYLEAESGSDTTRNALRLSPQQVAEVLPRLSAAAKKIAVAQVSDSEMKDRISALPIEIMSDPVKDYQFNQVEEKLKEAPPVKFDVARQVRVYESYLQYVELKLTGAAIQRHRVKIPSSLLDLGGGEIFEGRLRTTFDLIKRDTIESSKSLEDHLREIRASLTPSLGKNHGRVILKKNRPLLDEELTKLRKKLEEFRKEVLEKLQTQINESRQQIIDYYLTRVMETPPLKLRAQFGGDSPTEESARKWLKQALDREFPSAESLTKEIKLDVHFKDVTFENLRSKEFLEQVRNAFPDINWDRAHGEFTAAGESNSKELKDKFPSEQDFE